MKRTTFQPAEIDRARQLLGLGEQASIGEIKTAYRIMCKRWHPDTVGDSQSGQERIKKINDAYRLLLEYCESYPCSFAPETVESFDAEKWWYNRFGENVRARPEEEHE
ncbi:MAG: J domain-containing protein [Deltaproteobacteria bacterium]|nr:MAG: J domain-containing protein [Deltaproteobacteria bacterium]